MSVKDEVFELAQKVPRDPAQLRLPTGLDDEQIERFELRTGILVPEQLRNWLRFTNGPRIGMEGIYGIETTEGWQDIERLYKQTMFPEWRLRGWVPVSGDGCGNYFVLATRSEDGPGNPVFFMETTANEHKPAYVVASDWFHFLRFYLRHALGERGWPFDQAKVLAEDPALKDYGTYPKAWEVDD